MSIAFYGLIFVFFLTLGAYLPGLGGSFIFDDFATLARLGDFGEIKNIEGVLRFVMDDISGLGRQISLISFLLNGQNWPADPIPFKATNLALHLVIGAILYSLAARLLRVGGSRANNHWAALLIASFWLSNPFQVSTVLYVVQRMAQLSALFVLLGLLAYIHGRSLLFSRPRLAYAWMSAALVLITPLAVMAKENGALLPLLILVLEYTVLRHGHAGLSGPSVPGDAKPSKQWEALFLWLPSFLVVMAISHFTTAAAFQVREFNAVERLMTEARILFDYLYHWLNPFALPKGVLSDDIVVSRHVWSPWTTLPSLLAGSLALGWAVWNRASHPYMALAILFFMVGHLMESTVLPLELYFEHRNYLPAMFLAMPVAVALTSQTKISPRLVVGACIVVIAAQIVQTHLLASVWGNPVALSSLWAQRNPTSDRAQDHLANTLSEHHRPDLAVGVLEQAIRRKPQNSHFVLHLLYQKCRVSGVSTADLERARMQFKRYTLGPKSYPLLVELMGVSTGGTCPGMTPTEMDSLVDILMKAEAVRMQPSIHWQLHELKGELLLRQGHVDSAMPYFHEALRSSADISVGLRQVALLGSFGQPKQALDWLNTVDTLPRPVGWRHRLRSLDYDAEIKRLRNLLQDDLHRQLPPDDTEQT